MSYLCEDDQSMPNQLLVDAVFTATAMYKSTAKARIVKTFDSFNNAVCLVELGKDLVVIKLFVEEECRKRDDDVAKCRRELEVMKHLASTLAEGLTPEPLYWFFDANGIVPPFIIMSPLNGKSLITYYCKTKAGPHVFREAGQVLASVHNIDFRAGFSRHVDRFHVVEDIVNWRKYVISKCRERLNRLIAFGRLRESIVNSAERFFQDYVASYQGIERYSLVHGDATLTNFLENGTTVTGLIDFERAFVGDPVFDFVRVEDGLASFPDCRTAFWKGYRSRIVSWRDDVKETIQMYRFMSLLGKQILFHTVPLSKVVGARKRQLFPILKDLVEYNFESLIVGRDDWKPMFPHLVRDLRGKFNK